MKYFAEIAGRLRTGLLLALALLGSVVSSCHCFDRDDEEITPKRVLLVYAAGFNSLSGYLKDNIAELKEGYLPPKNSENVLLLASRLPASYGNYSVATPTYLIRLYKDGKGHAVCDTLSVPGLPENAVMSTQSTLSKILGHIADTWPDCSYGMVFSSHGTGWLPAGYYADPGHYDPDWNSGGDIFDAPVPRRYENPLPEGAVPYVEWPSDPDSPAVRSLGQDVAGSMSFELSLKDIREALPFHLDYLLLDACLMGGVEVAYELREKVDLIGFSQTEVLAEGFNYREMAGTLLQTDGKGPLGVCSDYYARYEVQTGSHNSATISLVDCRRMEPLAKVCRELFEKYRAAILAVDPASVQRYYRYERHWFYDLKDILVQAGISAEEETRLDSALAECILYLAATPNFLSIPIERFSGLSMFLPADGSAYIKNFYRENIDWNTATALVQ